jgi:hypothetical protein
MMKVLSLTKREKKAFSIFGGVKNRLLWPK